MRRKEEGIKGGSRAVQTNTYTFWNSFKIQDSFSHSQKSLGSNSHVDMHARLHYKHCNVIHPNTHILVTCDAVHLHALPFHCA